MSATVAYAEKEGRGQALLQKHKMLLRQIEDESVACAVALTINNQIYYNAPGDRLPVPDFIRQISVPAAIHIIASLPHDIISVQPFEDSKDNKCYFFGRAADYSSMDSYVVTPKKETNISIRDMNAPIAPHDLAVHCMELACCVTDETVHEIIANLTKRAGHQIHCQVKTPLDIINSIKSASDQINRRIKRSATFVVLPVAIARLLKKHIASDYDFDSLPINIRRIGMLQNRWAVYINAYDQAGAIVGYRGVHSVDAGVAFSPHVLFYEPIKDEKAGRYTIHKRYQVTVTEPDYFAHLELNVDSKAASMMALA